MTFHLSVDPSISRSELISMKFDETLVEVFVRDAKRRVNEQKSRKVSFGETLTGVNKGESFNV